MTTMRCDLTVVGAGPAGMAAAATAAENGLSVTVIDSGTGFGGQYWRQPPPPSDNTPATDHLSASETRHLHHDLDSFHHLCNRIEAAQQSGMTQTRFAHSVWAITRSGSDFTIRAAPHSIGTTPAETTIRARAVILATGAYDRQIPFTGWTLPGVTTAGALQALLKGNAVLPGSRVAVGGSGPFLLPVAAGLVQSGAQVVGVFEHASGGRWLRHPGALATNPAKLAEGAQHAMRLLRGRVPYHRRTRVVAAHGDDRVESITTIRHDAAGRPIAGSRRRYEVDAVGTGWGFTPQLELPMQLGCRTVDDGDGNLVTYVGAGQRSSVDGVYVAGEAAGIGGAALAVLEGGDATEAACHDLGVSTRRPARGRARKLAAQRRFAAAMRDSHPRPRGWAETLDDHDHVCRCEEVDYATIRTAVTDHDAQDSRQVKQLTRSGMGWCQARVCGYATDCLVADLRGEPVRPQPPERPVAAPVPLGSLRPEPQPRSGPYPTEESGAV